ncbi:MAG: YIP1 family protein [Chloroflexota bacterium]|nr:YIP1 family protein [Chloroflexota bacterium]
MIKRMLRASMLDAHVYEEVESDSSAIVQAALVVVVVAVAKGVATLSVTGNILGIVFGIIAGLLSWAIWAFITYLVGTKLLKTEETESSWGELARVTGFAQSPGLLFVVAIVPIVGTWIIGIASLWQLVAMVVGIRQALDYTSTLRAIGVVLIGFVVVIPLQVILYAVLA